MQKIRIEDVRIDGGTQARVKLNQYKVAEYAQQMTDGEVFPPIVVFHDGSDYWLASGFHRYFGHKENNATTIDAIVKNGTLEDATLFGLGDNKHGLNMTAEDYRKSIEIMLKHPKWGGWSNNQIAKHIGVSAMTVGRVKKDLEIPSKEATYTSKSGKETKMDTSNIGKKKAKETVEEPVYDESQDKVKELGDTVLQLAEENTLLRDKIAIGQWDATEIEKIDIEEVVANLREQIRILEIDNQALRESRDMFQNKYNEAVKVINSMKRKNKEA